MKRNGIFAERRLVLRVHGLARNILVELGPITRSESDACCRYKVSGFDETICREIWGLDDVQALQLALGILGTELNRLGSGGSYSIEGDADGEAGHGFQPLIA